MAVLAENLGMSQAFTELGDLLPVTAIKCGPCVVVQKKLKDTDGYVAIQLGFKEEAKLQRVNRAKKGHFQKAGTPIFRHSGEFRFDNLEGIDVGDQLGASLFEVGDMLNIQGRTKGRGFQGVMKRHGKHGGPAAHGSNFHRAPGSIGMCQDPGRVIKNMKLPGQMGGDRVTVKNLKVIEIDVENNLLFVKGSVPGCKSGMLRVMLTSAAILDRLKKQKEKAKEVPVESPTENKASEEVLTDESKKEV